MIRSHTVVNLKIKLICGPNYGMEAVYKTVIKKAIKAIKWLKLVNKLMVGFLCLKNR